MDNVAQQDPDVGNGAVGPPQDFNQFMINMNRYMETQNAIQQEMLTTQRRVFDIEHHLGAQIAGE